MSKTILITGTSTGFGRDTAETLARSDHKVFASMCDPINKNRVHADALQAKGIEVIELDVTNMQSVERAVATIVAKANRIDVLINNAGVASVGVSEAFTDDQASALFDVNVIGLHRVTRAVLPTLRNQRDGLIINIGSKTDSGYYDGSYGKGAYWVTPGLYGSMFSVDGNNVINSDGANSSTDKSLDSIREGADKPKRYFIYSYYQLDQASDFIQISHDVARSETELMRNKLRLPRKIQVKISRVMQSKNFIQA